MMNSRGMPEPASMAEPVPAPPVAVRLGDRPDWRYLLREFYEMYRFSSAGGSALIRAHQRKVREAIGRALAADPEVRLAEPQGLPATAHLRRALDEGKLERLPQVVRAVDAIAPALSWQYGYDKIPPGLAKKYAFAEIAGPRGPVVIPEVTLGLVLFAPRCTYPAHAHKHITESYVCLSGAVSENHTGVYAPGSMIFNPPGHMHRITVSDHEPALLAYAWIGTAEELAATKMRLGASA